VQGGQIDFDRCIATPDMMRWSAGSVRCWTRGMMPNPNRHRHHGRRQRREGCKGGSVEFRVEKAGIVQAASASVVLGREAGGENVKALADAVRQGEASRRQGTYIQRVAVSSTMGRA